MKKRTVCLLLAAVLCMPLFSGCLRFTNSLDLSTPITNAYAPITLPTQESVPLGTPDEPTASVPDEQLSAPSDPAAETTVPAPGGQTTSPAGSEPSSVPAQQGGVAGIAEYVRSIQGNDYEVLRSNACSLKAAFDDGKELSDVDMAMGDGQVYIGSDMDGLRIGLYIKDKKTYIYLPDQKKYLKLNAMIAGMMGVDPDEFTSAVEEFGFDQLPPLSAAKNMADGSFGGRECKVFTLVSTDNTEVLHVYLAGKKLLAIEYCDMNGVPTSTMKFESVTSGFPQMPPAGYSEIGYVEFGKILMSTMN